MSKEITGLLLFQKLNVKFKGNKSQITKFLIDCIRFHGYIKEDSEIIDENFAGYFLKYRNQVAKLIKKDPELALPENKMRLALYLGDLNQKRCQTLLFRILNDKINNFWD
jgi:hypothetical protein